MSFSKELITVLDYLAQKFGIVIDWTSSNVMPYLQDLATRYIEYEIFNSVLVVVGWALALAVATCFMIPLHCKANRLDWNWDRATSFFAVCGWVAFLVCVAGLVLSVICEGFHVIECWKMPEKVIIEYVQGLLESSK